MNSDSRSVLVAACGNPMAGDDAFGPQVAEYLRQRPLPYVEVVDLGMQPTALLNHLPGRRGVIVVDAAQPQPGFPAGTLIDLDFDSPRRPALRHDAALSSHGLSIAHELQLARQLNLLPPQVYLVAAALTETTLGRPLSPELRRLIPPAVQRIEELAARCQAPTSGTPDA